MKTTKGSGSEGAIETPMNPIPITSKEMRDAQVARDRQHHQERLAWLSEPNPCYSDGVPVAPHDANNMRRASMECLADKTGCTGYNTGPTEDPTTHRLTPSLNH